MEILQRIDFEFTGAEAMCFRSVQNIPHFFDKKLKNHFKDYNCITSIVKVRESYDFARVVTIFKVDFKINILLLKFNRYTPEWKRRKDILFQQL